jgi:hypothetical protein
VWKIKSVKELEVLLAIHKASRYAILLKYGLMPACQAHSEDGDLPNSTQGTRSINNNRMPDSEMRHDKSVITIEIFQGRN